MTLGHRIGQVKVVFSSGPQASKLLFSANRQPPTYLAYIEWFKLCGPSPKPNHLLYRVQRSKDSNGFHLASIIPVDAIKQSIHLIPQFGPVAPRHWQTDNVLDLCKFFYVNSFFNRQSYHTVI